MGISHQRAASEGRASHRVAGRHVRGLFVARAGVYVGTATGTLFYSRNSGEKWQILAEYLPPIFSVTASVH
jgi:hypothetical protein